MSGAKTLLIVEGNPELARAMAAHFADLGYDVDWAPDGLDALMRISAAPPRVVLVGLTTPRLGGVHGLRLLRRWHPGISVVLNDAVKWPRRTLADSGDARADEHWRALDRLVALATATPPPATAALEERLPGPAPTAPPRVLVVDDVEDMRDLLRDALLAEGHAVEVAPDAATAISTLASFKPQAILLDISMPGLSGIAALQHLRARDPQAGIIMVTGSDDEDMARQTLALGAFDYVRKPVDFDYLRRSIRTLFALQSLTRPEASPAANA